jgi:hypothetical protein
MLRSANKSENSSGSRAASRLWPGKCKTVSAWHSDNDLPLLWPIHARYRSLLFELIDLMNIGSATQDRSLLDALAIVRKPRRARGNEVLDPVNLSFASLRWQSFIRKIVNAIENRRDVYAACVAAPIWVKGIPIDRSDNTTVLVSSPECSPSIVPSSFLRPISSRLTGAAHIASNLCTWRSSAKF